MRHSSVTICQPVADKMRVRGAPDARSSLVAETVKLVDVAAPTSDRSSRPRSAGSGPVPRPRLVEEDRHDEGELLGERG